VLDVDEAGLGSDAAGPCLDLWPFDFLGSAAAAADEVVMVGVGIAAAVDRLPIGGVDDVDHAGVGQALQVPVDGTERDPVALATQLNVQVLGAVESLGAGELVGDECALPGGPPPGHGGRVWRLDVPSRGSGRTLRTGHWRWCLPRGEHVCIGDPVHDP
jgi:hypothetical protein